MNPDILARSLFLIAAILVFAVPLAQALLRGISFVRDPAHRVLPMSPWEQLFRFVVRRLQWWWPIWGFISVGTFLLPFYFVHRSGGTYLDYRIDFGRTYSCLLLASWLVVLMVFLALAPRCKETWSLCLISLGSSILAIEGLGRILFTHGGGNYITTSPLVYEFYAPEILRVCIAFALLEIILVWLRGPKWFRFKG